MSIPQADLGRKLGYDESLDVITYVNRTAQDNPESETVAEQVDTDEHPFEVTAEELDNLLAEIQKAKRRISKRHSPSKENVSK